MTSQAVTIRATSAAPALPAELVETARRLHAAARAQNTVRAYKSAMRHFGDWCHARGVSPLPAEPGTLIAYISDQIERASVATMNVRLAAIAQAHERGGFPQPMADRDAREVWRGFRNTVGAAPKRRKAAAVLSDVRAMIDAQPETLIGKRNRALLAIGLAGALRRSELVALDVADLVFRDEGLVIQIRKSKTDQEGEGAEIPVKASNRAVALVKAWLEAAGITEGAVFRSINRHGHIGGRLSDHSAAEIVKAAAAAAGLTAPANFAGFSGHSLRSGAITTAAKKRAPIGDIQRISRHKSLDVLLGYVRSAELFDNSAADSLAE